MAERVEPAHGDDVDGSAAPGGEGEDRADDVGERLGAHLVGAEVTELIQGYVVAMNHEATEESISRRRAAATRELYGFRARLGLDDGVAELMIYAAEPVRDLTELILDEWDRQFREHGYSLTQLDA